MLQTPEKGEHSWDSCYSVNVQTCVSKMAVWNLGLDESLLPFGHIKAGLTDADVFTVMRVLCYNTVRLIFAKTQVRLRAWTRPCADLSSLISVLWLCYYVCFARDTRLYSI